MGRFVTELVASLIWIYSYITLGFIMAVAALPGFLLGRAGWRIEAAGLLDPLIGVYLSILGYFVFGLNLMWLLPLIRFVFRLKTSEGEMSMRSLKLWTWYNYNGMIFMFNTVFARFARATTLYPWYLRGMGAKIGPRCVINTGHIYDHDLLEIGEHTTIGANASILGHVGEKGRLVRQRVKIGKNCTVGQFTSIFPGVTMGDNCHVGAMSLVPKGTTLDANAIYGGVPVKKIKDLKPGQGATSDEVSATTGGRTTKQD